MISSSRLLPVEVSSFHGRNTMTDVICEQLGPQDAAGPPQLHKLEHPRLKQGDETQEREHHPTLLSQQRLHGVVM